jgi:hypothetical protein
MAVNPLFFLATATFGWGLSLATYRLVASRYGWPMGDTQAHHPVFVILIGIVALIISFLFAVQAQPGSNVAGWAILALGVLFAMFWTGFLRVASQTALFLAPLATFLLVLGWAATDDIAADMRYFKERMIDFEKKAQANIEDRIQRRRNERGATPDGTAPVEPKSYQPQ